MQRLALWMMAYGANSPLFADAPADSGLKGGVGGTSPT
jgi:hypothetical protein